MFTGDCGFYQVLELKVSLNWRWRIYTQKCKTSLKNELIFLYHFKGTIRYGKLLYISEEGDLHLDSLNSFLGHISRCKCVNWCKYEDICSSVGILKYFSTHPERLIALDKCQADWGLTQNVQSAVRWWPKGCSEGTRGHATTLSPDIRWQNAPSPRVSL